MSPGTVGLSVGSGISSGPPWTRETFGAVPPDGSRVAGGASGTVGPLISVVPVGSFVVPGRLRSEEAVSRLGGLPPVAPVEAVPVVVGPSWHGLGEAG